MLKVVEVKPLPDGFNSQIYICTSNPTWEDVLLAVEESLESQFTDDSSWPNISVTINLKLMTEEKLEEAWASL